MVDIEPLFDVLELLFIGACVTSFISGFLIGFLVRHLMREK